MGNFGGWAMDRSTYDYICEILPEGKTILEIGSGFGTGQLAKSYKMYSIEADLKWVDKYDSTYIYSPIKRYDGNYIAPDIPGEKGWHELGPLELVLPKIKYDLIFIDGPEGCFGRAGFLKHIDLFNTNVPIIFDDINREPEFLLMQKVSVSLGRPYHVLNDKTSGVILV